MAQNAQVRLHVYDATGKISNKSVEQAVVTANNVLKALGTGVFHSAVEVYGREFGYGACFMPGHTGVYESRPGRDLQHTWREVIDVGCTTLSKDEVEQLLWRLEREWMGTDYDLLRRNCSHFTAAFLEALGVDPVPSWIQSLARVGAELDSLSEVAAPHVRSCLRRVRPWESFLELQKPQAGPDLPKRVRSNLEHFWPNYALVSIVFTFLFLLGYPRRLFMVLAAPVAWAILLTGRLPGQVLEKLGVKEGEAKRYAPWLLAVTLALIALLAREALLFCAVLALVHAAAHPAPAAASEAG